MAPLIYNEFTVHTTVQYITPCHRRTISHLSLVGTVVIRALGERPSVRRPVHWSTLNNNHSTNHNKSYTHSYFVITGSTMSNSIRLPKCVLSAKFSILRCILIVGGRPLTTLPLCMPQYFIVFDSPWTWALSILARLNQIVCVEWDFNFLNSVSYSNCEPIENWPVLHTVYFVDHHIFNLTLQWHHNERDGVSNHQPHDCLFNRLFGRR